MTTIDTRDHTRAFSSALRGYDKDEVDAFLAALPANSAAIEHREFSIALRGYDRAEVRDYLFSLAVETRTALVEAS